MEKLKKEDFIMAAAELMCDQAAIKAVAEVESSGSGFLLDGRIKVLHEGHVFYRLTHGQFASSNPTICYKKWTKEFYCRGKTQDIRGACELNRWETAISLNKVAGLQSASMGKFQVMGFNYGICGFGSAEKFVEFMKISEANHLVAFCRYVKGVRLDDELRSHSWAAVAKGYNGPEYWKNAYDKKLAAAHAKYTKYPDLIP